MINRIDIHNHTRYSNLRLKDALPTPEALIDRALALGLSGISISDHECLSAHPKANMYAQKIKEEHPDFKVILGNEIYLVDERNTSSHYHFVLTAKDAIGHYQLRRLSTIAWLNSYNAKGLTRVDTLKSDLKAIVYSNPGHLIASSACIGGELGQAILDLTIAEKANDQIGAAIAHNKIVDFILWCKEIFGDDFYLEVQPGVSSEQVIVNQRMVNIAKCFEVKMIPTSDSHYLKKEDRYVHKSFLNSEEKEREVDAFYQDAYLHSNEEMIEKFKKSGYLEEFVNQLFENSMEIYNKIEDYSLLHSQQIPHVKVKNYPKKTPNNDLKAYPTIYNMYNSDNEVDRYWVNRCIDRLIEIGKYNDIYLTELEEEAEVKKVVGERLDTNMYSYPIALAHYIDLIWECGSPVGVGRGSACSALNHYLLGITQLDPIEWKFPFFRYMNRDTDGLGDIDIDVAPSKVQMIVSKIKRERSQDFNVPLSILEKECLGANYVCTFGTESSKSAVQTACRGYRSEEYKDGIDIDTAQYLSSLIPSERGFVWSISDVYFGNKDKDRQPITAFINEVDKYDGLLDIMLGIEGCISRRGRHASGVLFLNEDPYEFNAFMKTPSGEIVTQYDLHDAEACGSTKMDILVTEVQDKIAQTLKMLNEAGDLSGKSLKEIYDRYIHPDVLPRNDEATWKIIQNAASLDLFQLDSEIGRQGAKKVRPTNMIEMSSTNGLIRLMTAEKGEETWLDKYVRYKNNIKEYYNDIKKYHLSKETMDALNKYIGDTYGIGISQEQLMKVLMDEEICGYTLKEANKARKIVSKKKMKEIPVFKQQVYEKAKSEDIADYVWDYVVSPGLGYSFSDIHSLSYSFIGFQTAYLATHWNPIYWNTACLIVNSGSLEDNSEEEIVDIYAPEAQDIAEGVTFEDLPDRSGKIRRTSGTDYSKLAKAIGDIRSKGIKVSLIDINKSSYGFKPDIENNEILFGLKALSKVGDPVIEQIIANRPYTGIVDFMSRCPLNKTAMISLIKAGAFDKIDSHWASKVNKEPRAAIMAFFIHIASEPKTKLNMQNFSRLLQSGLIPEELDFQKRVFNFNKYLKENKYVLGEAGSRFYHNFFDGDTTIVNNEEVLDAKIWEKEYKAVMDVAKSWLIENQDKTLKAYNEMLFMDMWNKYATGTVSAWEMESLCFYYHDHELKNVNSEKYGLVNFFKLSEEPQVEKFFKRGGNQIPIYKLYKIAGTILSKNDTRSSISVLTLDGVVNVKFTKEYFAMYNRQISEIQEDGKKKVIDKGWMARGNKVLITGFRRDDTFVGKTYKDSATHQLYLIENINEDGSLELRHERG